MSFFDYLSQPGCAVPDWERFDQRQVEAVLAGGQDSLAAMPVLLSPAAGDWLEAMAQRASQETARQFGRVILLYSPLYLADYCDNVCLYCGFNVKNPFPRRRLSAEEIVREGQAIAATGVEHLLLLTGESRRHADVAYILEAMTLVRDLFASLCLEVYPLEEKEYRLLADQGLDGVTIYQEVYDPVVYRHLHPAGPKADYRRRLETPERVCRARVRTVNIGALLGLNDWRREMNFLAHHVKWLQENFPDTEISVSVPRLQSHLGNFPAPAPVSDRELVQIILAWRIAFPWIGLTLSTRERASLRDGLVGLGITKLSAGSRTDVGGYTGSGGTRQFDMADHRSVAQIRQMIINKGYQPIFRDWT
jgi:2-iminoacetate synthase